MFRPLALIVASVALLSGCDMLGIESPEKVAAAKEAEGRAVGGACRHAGRAIEDCYALNRRVDKAAIFAGWRDMNDYMRENKIEPVTPVIVAQSIGKADSKSDKAEKGDKALDGKPDMKGDTDTADKAVNKAKPRDAKS